MITVAESESDFRITTDTQYLASWVSYGVSIVRIWEKINRVITAPHCLRLYDEFHFRVRKSILFPYNRHNVVSYTMWNGTFADERAPEMLTRVTSIHKSIYTIA